MHVHSHVFYEMGVAHFHIGEGFLTDWTQDLFPHSYFDENEPAHVLARTLFEEVTGICRIKVGPTRIVVFKDKTCLWNDIGEKTYRIVKEFLERFDEDCPTPAVEAAWVPQPSAEKTRHGRFHQLLQKLFRADAQETEAAPPAPSERARGTESLTIAAEPHPTSGWHRIFVVNRLVAKKPALYIASAVTKEHPPLVQALAGVSGVVKIRVGFHDIGISIFHTWDWETRWPEIEREVRKVIQEHFARSDEALCELERWWKKCNTDAHTP